VSSGGGWSGGCSTYPQGELPSWGVVPCTPTNPSQGPAVSPVGLQPSAAPTSSPPIVQSQGSTLQNVAGITLPKNYQLWDTGDDIRTLQKFFNTHGFIIAAQGSGSPGNETSIFGTHTYQALIKFQQSKNLPQTGYLGPLTRAALGSSTTQ
jgi:peptidoglycan hydrolase-like protein with peptidoglycan-binding domain